MILKNQLGKCVSVIIYYAFRHGQIKVQLLLYQCVRNLFRSIMVHNDHHINRLCYFSEKYKRIGWTFGNHNTIPRFKSLTIFFMSMNVRRVDWTPSLWTAYMTKLLIDLQISRQCTEHLPRIHLKCMIHSHHQATSPHRQPSKWQPWLNRKWIHLVLTHLISLNSNMCWWTQPIPSVMQDIGRFPWILFRIHKITIHLEAQACYNNVMLLSFFWRCKIFNQWSWFWWIQPCE